MPLNDSETGSTPNRGLLCSTRAPSSGGLLALMRCAVLVIGLSLTSGAAAQTTHILVLTTNENDAETAVEFGAATTGGAALVVNVPVEFRQPNTHVTALPQNPALPKASAPGLETPGAINAATFIRPDGGRYDIVVVATAYRAMHASSWDVLRTAVRNRAANSFMIFADSCCQLTANTDGMLALLNEAMAPTTPLGRGPGRTGRDWLPLNAGSPYKASFASDLQLIRAGVFSYITNVPANNALYLTSVSTARPRPAYTSPSVSGNTLTTASAVLVPMGQSYRNASGQGGGACIFAVTDTTIFMDLAHSSFGNVYQENRGRVGPAMIAAATQVGGSCGVPAQLDKTFSHAAVYPGQQAMLTLTVTHLQPASGESLTDIRVHDVLPAPLEVAGIATTTCGGTLTAAVGGQTITLTGGSAAPGTLAAPGSCVISVPVRWASNSAGLNACGTSTADNQVVASVGFSTAQGQRNLTAHAALSCQRQALRLLATTADEAAGTFALTLSNVAPASASVITSTADTPMQVDADTGTAGLQDFQIVSASDDVVIDHSALPAGWSLDHVKCVDATGAVLSTGAGSSNAYTLPSSALGNEAFVACDLNYRRLRVALGIAKDNQVTQVVPGAVITYLIDVSNDGPDTAVGATVTDDWTTTPGVDCSTGAGGALTCDAQGSGASCPATGVTPETLKTGMTLGALPSGSHVRLALTCKVSG